MFRSMPAQRNTMKSRGLPLSNRHSRRGFLAAASALIVIAVTAAAFCGPYSAAAADPAYCTGQEGDTGTGELKNEAECPEKTERGILVLEDPCEKKRYAEYEMALGAGFSITFIHSVNKSPVTDYFEIRKDGIYGVKTAYYGFGAGVPTGLEEGQTLTYGEDGSMIISGMDVKMDTLTYRVGTVSDHILTLEDGSEISLRELCGRSARVGFSFELK